jgi:Pyruvate/2-oxoacid:ferredoxin oxidoreductase delta subunit
MDTNIYYFSGTGNSLAVARELTKNLVNCRLLPIAKALESKCLVPKVKKVGIVFPLYYVGLPEIVQRFVQAIELEGVQYVFCIVTKGWPIVGGAIKQVQNILNSRGYQLSAGFYIRMPMNDIIVIQPASSPVQERLLAAMPEKVNAIAGKVSLCQRYFAWEPVGFVRPLRNGPFIKRVHAEDRYFCTTDACSACGVCEAVCPVRNIVIDKDGPKWQGKCQQCLACFHFCPQHAIVFDKGKTKKQPQYRCSGITYKDIAQQKGVNV